MQITKIYDKSSDYQKKISILTCQPCTRNLIILHYILQLKEENKQYVEINAQLNSKLSQMDQLNQKLSIMHAEMLKAQEERKMAKEYAEKVTNEMKKAQEDVRSIQTKAQDEVRNIQSKAQEEVQKMQVKYSGQNQAMQMELNVN